MADPFVIVQDDVVSAFDQAKTLLASWKRLASKKRSPQEENEFQFTTDELHSTIKSIGTDLEDLQETIGVARGSPEEYGLTPALIKERQNFVSAKQKAIGDMRRAISRPEAKLGGRGTAPGNSSNGAGARRQPDHFAVEFGDQQQQQQVIMQQQDEHLDSMLDTVRNLHGIAGTMNTELDDQAVLLDEMGDLVDRTQSKLDSARQKVSKFLRDSSNRSLRTILILFVVILVLIALIILT
ncbi:Syntaxin-6 [Dipsacomyces acuminosporus]|nr:Syntaxin-6 [Dipsacomyces acuminosporus]